MGGSPGRPPIRKRVTYFFAATDERGVIRGIKIGSAFSGYGVRRRLLNLQTGSMLDLKILLVIEGAAWERKLHRRYAGFQLRGEFYKPAPELLRQIEALKEMQALVQRVIAQEAAENGVDDATDRKRNR